MNDENIAALLKRIEELEKETDLIRSAGRHWKIILPVLLLALAGLWFAGSALITTPTVLNALEVKSSIDAIKTAKASAELTASKLKPLLKNFDACLTLHDNGTVTFKKEVTIAGPLFANGNIVTNAVTIIDEKSTSLVVISRKGHDGYIKMETPPQRRELQLTKDGYSVKTLLEQ